MTVWISYCGMLMAALLLSGLPDPVGTWGGVMVPVTGAMMLATAIGCVAGSDRTPAWTDPIACALLNQPLQCR